MILTIDRNTFMWHKGYKGLVYNSSNYKSFTFNNVTQIEKVLRKLEKPENLYMVNLPNDFYKDEKLNEWVNNLIKIDAGKTFSDMKTAEASLLPIIKIHNDRERLLAEGNYLEMLNHIHEITFHVNGAILQENEANLYRQYFYPTGYNQILDYRDVLSFLESTSLTVRLNFVGDFSTYPHLSKVTDGLIDRRSRITFYSRIEDIMHIHKEDCLRLNMFNLSVLCRCNNDIRDSLQFVESTFENVHFDFLCFSDEDFSFVESLDLNEGCYNLIPVFDGKNSRFLQEYVFLYEDEIVRQKLEKRKIFINQTINGFSFGKILVFPDGSVKANANMPVIGNIHKNIDHMLNSLFDKDSVWFQTRDKKPCKNCIYQWLCPPISNYELLTSVGYFCNLNH